jgi:phospholipid/cholesterol/gamma-HCH transport system substrate-binding protein
MATQANYFKIGVFVISGTLIALIGILLLGAETLFRKTFMIETYFQESVQGLDIGSPLKFRGFRIGKVEDIFLAGNEYETEKTYIVVRASLSPDTFRPKTGKKIESMLNEKVQKGLRARLTIQGLTGTAHLDLDYQVETPSPPLVTDWTPKYLYVPSTPSTITRISVSIDRIMRSLEKVNFEEVTSNLKKALNAVTETLEKANIRGLGEQAERLLSEVRDTNRRIGDLLKGPKVDTILPDASATMAGARRIVENGEKPLSQLMESLQGVSSQITRISKHLETFSGSLPESLVEVKGVLRRLNDLITSQKQEIEESIRNIKIATENIRELSENVKRHPSQLLMGKPPRHFAPGEE